MSELSDLRETIVRYRSGAAYEALEQERDAARAELERWKGWYTEENRDRTSALKMLDAARAECARLTAALEQALEGVRELDGGTYAQSFVADDIEDALKARAAASPGADGEPR